jgi:hypothetical protein
VDSPWKKAERIVRGLVKNAYLTPGSGSKGLQGDVRAFGKIIEVKQTSKPYMDIKRDWLLKLEQFAKTHELALAVFFDMRGYVYYCSSKSPAPVSWRTCRAWEANLPETLCTDDYVWELDSIHSLKFW